MNRWKKVLLSALCLLFLLPVLAPHAEAAKDLDEIVYFEVTVDVNQDATLRMRYHIEWKVLDSTSDGPLTWVKIGIPNSRYVSMKGRSRAVSKIDYSSDGGSYARIDLDRAYRAGEIVEIDFELVQDYMYQVNGSKEGETVYSFTPSWFDEIRVDELVIRWNGEKVSDMLPGTQVAKDGYITWTRSLGKGEKFTVTVSYPNDAYGFDLSKTIEEGDEGSIWEIIIGVIVFFGIALGGVAAIATTVSRFTGTANFSNGTKTVVKRTKVVYYPVCQGCGAPRPDGANNCQYCGRSFIKSEEVISEEDIPKEEKELRRKKEDGLYSYSTMPNTYMRVHVTHITLPRSSSGSRGGGGGCAHSSCACACACACAGGGRAGCSVKDFYNTHLKLTQLKAKSK